MSSDINKLQGELSDDKIKINISIVAFVAFFIYSFEYGFDTKYANLAFTNLFCSILSLFVIFLIRYKFLPPFFIRNGLPFAIYLNVLGTYLIGSEYLIPSIFWFSLIPVSALIFNNIRNATHWSIIIIITTIFLIMGTLMNLIPPNQYIIIENYHYVDVLGFNITMTIALYFLNILNEKVMRRLVETNVQLEKAKNNEIESQKFKDLFFANISHELRTPLNSIVGLTNLLKKGDADPEMVENIETIQYSSKLLLNIINDILDLSKLNENKFQLYAKPDNIRLLVMRACDMMRLEAESKHLNFVLHFSDDFPNYAEVDNIRVTQIIVNLVKNAIKFTNVGHVKVEGKFNKNMLVISVEDTGIGMDEKYLTKVFSNYTQESEQISKKFGGTGLGLSISYKLAKLMNGDLVCESVKNEGSTFTFSIPYKAVTDLEVEAALPSIPSTVDAMPDKLKVIIADDNPINLMVEKKLITVTYPDFQIYLAENGLQVLELLEKEAYDLILMDLQMPELNGIEATKVIRLTNKTIKIIALTASINDSLENECLEAGMDGFLNKPFAIDALVNNINKLFVGAPKVD